MFDLDHTLLDGDTDVLWCDFLVAQGVLAYDEFAPRNADMAARYRQGQVDLRDFCNFYVGTLAGHSAVHWEPLRQTFFRSKIVPHIPDAARALVDKHQDAGDLVVLTTATNRYLTELTAIYLGIEHLIATEPEINGAIFTGQCTGTLNMREGKVARLKDWLHARGHALKDFESTAYSDSMNDLPLMQVVNHAVAVNPDARLRAYAQAHSWPVMRLAM